MKKNLFFPVLLLISMNTFVNAKEGDNNSVDVAPVATVNNNDTTKEVQEITSPAEMEELIKRAVEEALNQHDKERNNAPKTDSPHPCISFGEGTKEASYAARLLTDFLIVFAGCQADTPLAKAGAAAFPFYHHLVHHETANLKHLPYFRWLANNWASLGLSALVGTVAKTMGLQKEQIYNSLIATLYAQGALAVAVAKLEERQTEFVALS